MPHSYSSWSTFNKCPARYKYSYIEKVPVPEGEPHPAMARGTEIHDSIEQYVLGEQEYLHPDIHQKYGQWVFGLRESYECAPELRFAMTRNWKPTKWDAKNAWVRGFLDLKLESDEDLIVYEWKTGRMYDDHQDQRFLYGMVALQLFTGYSTATVHGVYFDQKRKDWPDPENYDRENLPFMQAEWTKRFTRLETEEVFPPNPTFLCKYCPFSTEAGGPCQF